MRLTLGPWLLAFVLACATPASAEPLFDSFQTSCAKTNGALAKISEQAANAGWMQMPDGLLTELSSGLGQSPFKVRDLRGWVRSDRSAMTFLVAGRAEFPVKVQASGLLCAVGSVPSETAAVSSLTRWAAVPPIQGQQFGKDVLAYVFSTLPDGRHKEIPASALANSASALRALSDPGARVIGAQTNAEVTLLMQVVLEREL